MPKRFLFACTRYILQALDSVQKNIGEALAVIVIYIHEAFRAEVPGQSKSWAPVAWG